MYKIIHNNRVIDVVKYPQFINFLASGHIAMTDKTSANGIVGSDNKTTYSFQPNSKYLTVSIEEITFEEFERLNSLLDSDKVICHDEAALISARDAKLKQLSNICKSKISTGFSITLSDGKAHEFKLTAEDQLNLMSMEGQLNAGAEAFIYHATNQPCQVFSREDIIKILNAFRRHITYHTTYFNTAKQYINTLIDIEKIDKFVYGNDTSSVVASKVIKQILKDGDSSL